VGLLAEQGARIDAIYFCPFLAGEEAKVERYRQESELRKPKPGMILQASLERGIDLAGSWMVGDALHDAQAGRAAGCRTILVRRPDVAEPPRKTADVDFVADTAEDAARIVIKYTRLGDKPPARNGNANSARHTDNATDASESAALLQEILTFLRTVDRRSRAEEFSLGKLMGALVQILVVGVLVYSIFGWLRNIGNTELLVRLQFATLLQLMALTCFSLTSRK
jgi:hypothetical protein